MFRKLLLSPLKALELYYSRSKVILTITLYYYTRNVMLSIKAVYLLLGVKVRLLPILVYRTLLVR